ncbi:MAG: hypothetical protein RJA36_2931 [Pseudomonadota bacterium]|jgi:outer membrane protein
MIHRSLIAATVFALCASATGATDLLQVWEAASRHDPQGAVTEAARAAGASRREQAAALWRPSVGLSASAGWAGGETRMNGAQFSAPAFGTSSGVSFGTSVNGGTATRWTLGARQPLYNAERSAQSRQLELAADAAELEAQAMRQDWMLQTAQRYFDLVLAERRLALLRRQQAAVEQALAEARDRYEIGDAPITDIHEAAARARALQAQAVAAADEHELALGALADSTGLGPGQLGLLAPSAQLPAGELGPLEHWLAQAGQDSPMIRLLQAQLDVAQAETRKYQATASATLDLVAQAARERLGGAGDHGSASSSQSQQMVGVALNVPIYTGGWRSAKLDESLRLEDKARAELERGRLQLGQMTRAAWLAQHSGQARLTALEQALVASRARLDATRLGRQVGDRTTLDLLNAENDASAAELVLLQGRSDILLSRLRLDALSGQLDTGSLQAVNACLQP